MPRQWFSCRGGCRTITFGNESSAYSAKDVIVLADGSIVTLGTADLEPIRKIVVIKTGPNGETSFE